MSDCARRQYWHNRTTGITAHAATACIRIGADNFTGAIAGNRHKCAGTVNGTLRISQTEGNKHISMSEYREKHCGYGRVRFAGSNE